MRETGRVGGSCPGERIWDEGAKKACNPGWDVVKIMFCTFDHSSRGRKPELPKGEELR